jgi:glycosyltransferase involved in cell wall biosynthesis
MGNAKKYLKAYLSQVEDDGWATATLAKIEAVRNRVSNSAKGAPVVAQDFEFSPRASQREFEPEPGRVRYFLHNSLPFDSAGYATRTHGLLSALNKHGWDAGGVTRFGYPYDKDGFDPTEPVGTDVVDGVDYQRLVTGVTLPVRKTPVQTFVTRYVESAEELIRRDRPSVLHGASNHWNGLAVAELARRYDLPSVYEVRGLWELTRASREPGYEQTRHYRERAAIEAKAANACDRVITITGALADEMISRGVPEDKITVVPNGVDTSRFTPLERDEELADKLGIGGRTVVGYVGSVLDYEGIDDLVDVAERLLKRRDDVVFLIVGDGAKFADIAARVDEAGLGGSVILTGRVPHAEVSSYYSLIDICPFPRKPLPVCEAVSPLKPFEALAMGKAILGSDVAAIAEIIEDGVTGLLFEKGNLESLEQSVEKLLDNTALRESVERAGLEWVRRERDWLQLGGRVDRLYRELGVVPPTTGRTVQPSQTLGVTSP